MSLQNVASFDFNISPASATAGVIKQKLDVFFGDKADKKDETKDAVKENAKVTTKNFKELMGKVYSTGLNTITALGKGFSSVVSGLKNVLGKGLRTIMNLIDKIIGILSSKGALSGNRIAQIMNTNLGKLNALKQAEKTFDLEGLSDSMFKAYRNLIDNNKDASFLNLGFSHKEMERLKQTEGIDASFEIMQKIFDKVEQAGGWDNKQGVAWIKASVEDLGFDWDILKGLQKTGSINQLTNGATANGMRVKGLNQLYNSGEERFQAGATKKLINAELSANAIGQQAEGILSQVLQNIRDLIIKLMPLIQKVFDFLQNTIMPLIIDLKNFLSGLIDKVLSIGEVIVDSLIDFFAPLFKKIFNIDIESDARKEKKKREKEDYEDAIFDQKQRDQWIKSYASRMEQFEKSGGKEGVQIIFEDHRTLIREYENGKMIQNLEYATKQGERFAQRNGK